MKVLYNNQNGQIFYAVLQADWFMFQHTTNISLTEFNIEEVDPENKEVCLDLRKYGNQYRVDENGLNKYYIENNELHVRDEWIEYVREEFIHG